MNNIDEQKAATHSSRSSEYLELDTGIQSSWLGSVVNEEALASHALHETGVRPTVTVTGYAKLIAGWQLPDGHWQSDVASAVGRVRSNVSRKGARIGGSADRALDLDAVFLFHILGGSRSSFDCVVSAIAPAILLMFLTGRRRHLLARSMRSRPVRVCERSANSSPREFF